jgi:hypothetical protein
MLRSLKLFPSLLSAVNPEMKSEYLTDSRKRVNLRLVWLTNLKISTSWNITMVKVRMPAKSMFGRVIMNENKAIDKPKNITRRITRVRKSLKFKIVKFTNPPTGGLWAKLAFKYVDAYSRVGRLNADV